MQCVLNWILHLSSQASDSHCFSSMISVTQLDILPYLGDFSLFLALLINHLPSPVESFQNDVFFPIIPFLLSLLTQVLSSYTWTRTLSDSLFVTAKTKHVSWNSRPFSIWPKLSIFYNSVVYPLLQSRASREQQEIIPPWPPPQRLTSGRGGKVGGALDSHLTFTKAALFCFLGFPMGYCLK